MKKNFADTLKEMRIKAGYSQKEVYEMFNIRQSTFSAWETGRAEPSADMLLKLCQLYNISDILGAFGFDGYNEDGSIRLNINEIDIIEKYRSLDPHGKEMVDFTLQKEWERSTEENKPDNIISIVREPESDYLAPNAAHTLPNASAEDKDYDNDIMNDENF